MADLERNGYALADFVVSRARCEQLAAALPAVEGAGRGGVRNLITHPAVRELLSETRVRQALRSIRGNLVAVKATLFDKTADANWRVQWHQDLAIAVKERIEVPGFRAWSVKAGVPHVEPPAEVLAQMLAVRVHLDACGSENGPLLAIPGSHRLGKLPEHTLASITANSAVAALHVPQGAVLFLRPLLVHASSPASEPGHRRVLHIELAPPDLIAPLQWHAAVPI